MQENEKKMGHSRELKFRAWDGEKMYYADDKQFGFQFRGDGEWGFCDFGTKMVYAESRKGAKLMQYTGRHDKNGKEIYEGDIVKWVYIQAFHTSDVFFVNGGFYCNTNGFIKDLVEWQGLGLITTLGCEIIGNIYENPELSNNKEVK